MENIVGIENYTLCKVSGLNVFNSINIWLFVIQSWAELFGQDC